MPAILMEVISLPGLSPNSVPTVPYRGFTARDDLFYSVMSVLFFVKHTHAHKCYQCDKAGYEACHME